MASSKLDRSALRELLQRQNGLLTAGQAGAVGLSSSSLGRRLKSGELRRVLPLLYAASASDLTTPQRARAALLLGGQGACLTGAAALWQRRLPHLPLELTAEVVDMLVPHARHLQSTQWVRVTRTHRMPHSLLVDDLPTAPVTRAVVDAARWQSSYDVVLGLTCSALNAGRTTVAELRAELAAGASGGSRLLRRVLDETNLEVRSVAEARARKLFRTAGLPEPLVNQPLDVDGEVFVPDFRWGRVIVEIDSRAFHLLEIGAWDRTQARRARLRAAGYDVLSYTPEQIRDTPAIVIEGLRQALFMAAA